MGVLAVVATLGLGWAGGIRKLAVDAELAQTVHRSNASVPVYEVLCDSRGSASITGEVIACLQSVADAETAKRLGGRPGSAEERSEKTRSRPASMKLARIDRRVWGHDETGAGGGP